MFRPASTPPHFPTLVLLTALSVLTLNMFLPSLSNIARDLDTSYTLASLSVSAYLAVSGVLQLILGPIADRYGRRPVLLVAMATFVASSVVCAMAENIWVFLAARIVQGLVIAGAALAAAIISDVHPRGKAASLLGYLSMAMAVAPMLAPMIGGALDEAFGWRSGFWLYAGLGLLALWLVWSDVGETNPAPADTLLEQIKTYPELLVSRRYWGYTFCIVFGVGVFYVFISSAPLVGPEVFGLTTTQVGIGIGSITGGFFLGSFLSGRYSQRIGLLRMVVYGRMIALFGVGLSLIITVFFVVHPVIFFAGAVSAGFSNGLSIPNARAASMALKPHIAGSASGLSGALTVALGAVLTVLPGLVLTAENGAWLTLVIMTIVAAAAVAAALYARQIELQQAGPKAEATR